MMDAVPRLAVFCWGGASTAGAAAVGSATPVTASAVPSATTAEVVFPPPPEPPRLRFLYAIASPQDVSDPHPPFMRRVWNFMLGRKPDPNPAMARPYGVCAQDGLIYAADTGGAAVVVFDRAHRRIRRLGGSVEGRLLSPIGVAVDPGGTIWVTDSAQNVVKVFGPTGGFLAQFGRAGEFLKPTGIAWDAARHRFLVADTGHSRVVALDDTGRITLTFGGTGTGAGAMSSPVNLCIGPDGNIRVVDPILCKVQTFSPTGTFLSQFGAPGDTAGYFARPRGVAVDSDGNLYVADALFNAVQVFDQAGKLLLVAGAPGSVPGAFDMPAGLFIDPADRLYICDSMNRRIQVFQYLKLPATQR